MERIDITNLEQQREFVYLNDQFLPKFQASVSVTDFGFNFGAGIYEVAQVLQGKIFQLKEHLERFLRSCQLISLPLEKSLEDLSKICEEVKNRNSVVEGIIYLQATYGDYGSRSHFFPSKINSTLLIFTQPVKGAMTKYYQEGIKVKLLPDKRHLLCKAKTIGLLPNILAINQANSEGFQEAILYNETNFITECCSANVFCVKDGVVYTTPLTSNILPGITRQTLIELAKKNNILVKEENITKEFFLNSDEIFITSTSRYIWSVKQVEEKFFVPNGPITRILFSHLIDFIERDLQIKLPKFY